MLNISQTTINKLLVLLVSTFVFSLIYYFLKEENDLNLLDYFFYSFNIQCFFGMLNSNDISKYNFKKTDSNLLIIFNIIQVLITFYVLIENNPLIKL